MFLSDLLKDLELPAYGRYRKTKYRRRNYSKNLYRKRKNRQRIQKSSRLKNRKK